MHSKNFPNLLNSCLFLSILIIFLKICFAPFRLALYSFTNITLQITLTACFKKKKR